MNTTSQQTYLGRHYFFIYLFMKLFIYRFIHIILFIYLFGVEIKVD